MTSTFEPIAVLRALVDAGVEFVLIGGYAAAVRGAPHVTTDTDVCPLRSPENLDRLSDALRSLHARIRVEGIDGGLPFDHNGGSLARGLIWNLVTDGGDLDICFVPAGTTGYEDLTAEATTVDIGGFDVRLASLADIVRSKRAADRDKDHVVLPILDQMLRELESDD
jgi:hypothetical protein